MSEVIDEETELAAGRNPYCACPLANFGGLHEFGPNMGYPRRPIIGPGSRASDHEPGCCFGPTEVTGGKRIDLPPPDVSFDESGCGFVPGDVSLNPRPVDNSRMHVLDFSAYDDDEGLVLVGTPEERAAQKAYAARPATLAREFFEGKLGKGPEGVDHPSVQDGRAAASISLPELQALLEKVRG